MWLGVPSLEARNSIVPCTRSSLAAASDPAPSRLLVVYVLANEPGVDSTSLTTQSGRNALPVPSVNERLMCTDADPSLPTTPPAEIDPKPVAIGPKPPVSTFQRRSRLNFSELAPVNAPLGSVCVTPVPVASANDAVDALVMCPSDPNACENVFSSGPTLRCNWYGLIG